MKYIKTFERLGISDIVADISERAYEEFLKHYDKNKFNKNKYDEFKVNVSDILKNDKFFHFKICYDTAFSRGGFPIIIGAVSRVDNSKPKDLEVLKSDIYHEVEHMIHVHRKHNKLKGLEGFRDKKRRFLGPFEFKMIFMNDLIGSFNDPKTNIYGMKVSIPNFMECDKFTDTYKKIIVYLYLADQDEISARLHEFYAMAKKDFKKAYDETFWILAYKDMSNFKIDVNELTKSEKAKVFSMVSPKNIKKLERYINMQGQKIVKKIHKLSYFQDSEV